LDELWLQKVSPKDIRHALLLPPTFFSTNPETDKFWLRCDVYAEEQIPHAERLLLKVEHHHRKPDERGRSIMG
jgi:hypothetical protein